MCEAPGGPSSLDGDARGQHVLCKWELHEVIDRVSFREKMMREISPQNVCRNTIRYHLYVESKIRHEPIYETETESQL